MRNAPALMNLAWHPSMMWDGAVNHLDVQALAPISNTKEMGENISSVAEKLRRSKIYPPLFEKAFNDTSITGEKILKAISQFELTLISADSKYDKMKRGQAKFTEQESKGYLLFRKNCNSCHAEPLFSTYEFKNNGLPVDTTLNDWGRYTITKQSADSLMFKIPTLRNLSFTYPYMHDGRFKKLGQVLNHYASVKPASNTLADELKNPIQLNSNEKADLIAFLFTLNDTTFVFNPAYQFPKKILNQPQGK
jgi:cytochrome c peroxidase